MPLPLKQFTCTECARCCRSLHDPSARGLPSNAEALAQGGLYALPRIGGLQVWSWERRKMLLAAAEMGQPIAFNPALGVIDERSGDFIAILWELPDNECPLVRGNHCGAYDARPLICRAYPLLLQGREIVVSAHCPGAVYKTEPPEIESYLYHAYKPCAEAASFAGRMPEFAIGLLRFLETGGLVKLARGRPLEEAHARAARRVVDFTEFLAANGVFTPADLDARLAAIGARSNEELAARYGSA